MRKDLVTKKIKTAEKKKLFLKAYSASLCNISASCRVIKINRSTYYDWIDSDRDFEEKVRQAEESLIDFVENKLLEKIRQGDTISTIFYLKCKGKKRGYVEKTEIEQTGKLGFYRALDTIPDEDLAKVDRYIPSKYRKETVKKITPDRPDNKRTKKD